MTAVAASAPQEEAWVVDFRLLGPIEARAEGRPVAIPGGRQRALLALLLLSAGEPIARDKLIEDLWGERPPDGAVKTVQAVVSRLRRALGGDASRLITSTAGYRLRLEPDELDVARFERLADEGRRALAAGRPERAAARLRAALAEWRGPPLADVAFEPFAQPEIAHLEELRAAALEDRIEADLALGRGAELVGELEALVDREPHRERARAQLMLALYRAGRQAEALEAYREAVRTLGTELGLQPGAELERLQRAIVARDPALLRRTAAEAPAVERRVATATILFAETARPDPEAAHRLRDVLAAHGGTAVKALGDRMFAAFDASGDALACAVEMQRAIDRHAHGRSGAPGMRIGISAGDVAWEGDDPFGAAAAEAEALCAAAPPLGILVAEAVRLLAGSRAQVAFEDADEVAVPGGEPPLRAWAVGWTAERSVAVPLAAPLAIDPSAAFAGREAELAALRKAWSGAVADHGRGVFVSGEPGIGKTRLAAELAGYVRERGGIVLYGRCDEGLSAPAQPFAEALGAYAAACPIDELRVQLGPHAGQLFKLLPELADRMPGVAEPAPAEPELERLRTFEAVAALLQAAGDMSAVLFVLDDLHWADEFSLLLLRHLLRADTTRRLLVLATYRDTEPSASPLLAEVVSGLARRPDVERIELGSLAERDIAMILAHAGRESSLAGRVLTATEGNPFFVGEVVAALGEDGDPAAALTPRVRDVVRWRLARLPSRTANVLATAAVAGAEFDADVVAAADDVDLGAALDAIEAAERARLVRPAGVVGRFGFAHALVRQAILGDLPAGTRARVHARIAHALERVATTRAVPVGELATHFAAAGTLVDAGQAVRYAREAGDGAAARLAFDVAAEHYESAARAHERLPDAPAGERLDLDLARGRALVLAGDRRADPFLRAIAAAAEAAGDGARMADALLTIRLEYADFLEEDAEMVALLRRALALLPPGDSAITARLEAFLAQEAFSSVPDRERHQMVGRALAMARRVGDPRALASVLTSHTWIVAGPESLPQRLAIADELVAVGRAADLPYAECDGQQARFLALVELGDVAAADDAVSAAHAAARTMKSKWTENYLDAARALLAGRLTEAETAAARAFGAAALETAAPPAVAHSAYVRLVSCIRIAQGRLHEHMPARRAMAEGVSKLPPTFFVVGAHAARELDDRDDAREAIEQAVAQGLFEMPRGPTWTVTLLWAADICAWLRDRPRATRLHELLAPFAKLMTWQAGPVGRAVGRLELILGRPDEAERRLREAVALCERMDAQAFLAIARHELGTLLLPSPEGRRLVDEALAAADRLGMPGLTGRA